VSSLCSSRTSTTQQPGTSASSPQPQWVTYGDVQITTEGARCFTCIYITVSVSWLAAVVSLIGRLLEQRSADETEALYARDRQPHGSASHAQPCWARARRVTLWSCWAPRVPRLQVSRGVTELCWRLATERVQYVQKTRVFSGDIIERTLASVPQTGAIVQRRPDGAEPCELVST